VKHTRVRGVNTTIVYDASGGTLYQADDTKAAKLMVPKSAVMSATRIYEIINGSVIDHRETGNILVNDSANNLELRIIDIPHKDKFTGSASIANINENWVEFANQTYSSNTKDLGSFTAYWNVPSAPQETRRNEVPRGDYHWKNTTSMAAWMGVESPDSKGLSQGVFQSVSAWNWINDSKYGTEKNWSAAIWDIKRGNYAISTHISSNGLAINTGDEMRSTISYDTNSKTWTDTLTLVPQSGIPTMITMGRSYVTLDPRKVDLELVDEAYLLPFNGGVNTTTHLQKYMFSNVRFTNIEIKDQTGTVLSKNFVPYIVKDWNDHKSECPHIDVTIDSNPYKVWMHTTS
jgi:hypothetical protein